MADFQEPEVEICASMLDALNECVQVCTSIYEVGVCIISNKMHFFLIFLFILGISVVLCLLAKPILTKMGPNEILFLTCNITPKEVLFGVILLIL